MNSVVQEEKNPSLVQVVFDKEVNGATATNVKNYKVAGAVVEKAELLADFKTVKLHLKEGSLQYTGLQEVEVMNVTTRASGLVMEKYQTSVDLKENVKPVIKDVELTANHQIKLTFSEAVSNEDHAVDITLLIDGTEATTPKINQQKVTNQTEVVYELSKALTSEQLAKTLSIKVLETTTLKDQYHNQLKPTIVTIKK